MKNNQEDTRNTFIPGFLLGVMFGTIIAIALCVAGPLETRDKVIKELNSVVLEQAKNLDSLQDVNK